jgi:hypothetical protein
MGTRRIEGINKMREIAFALEAERFASAQIGDVTDEALFESARFDLHAMPGGSRNHARPGSRAEMEVIAAQAFRAVAGSGELSVEFISVPAETIPLSGTPEL